MYKLVKKAKEGDSEAIARIIEVFVPFILKEASKYRIKNYDYEDLVQHGYLSVIKAINMYKGEERYFKAYCFNTIRNNLRALLKGEIKHYREVGVEESALEDTNYSFTIEDEVIAYEEIKKLYSAIDHLSMEERSIIENFYFQGNTLDAVAATCNMSYNQIRYKKDKIIKKLQRELKVHIYK